MEGGKLVKCLVAKQHQSEAEWGTDNYNAMLLPIPVGQDPQGGAGRLLVNTLALGLQNPSGSSIICHLHRLTST